LSDNILDAYGYLMENFQPGDQVYIFGFSRGSYTARALCGLLEMVGLLQPGNEGLQPYAFRLYSKWAQTWIGKLRGSPNKFAVAKGFRNTFCRDCKPHFLGLWDTVSSIGLIQPISLKPGNLPFTASLLDVSIIRHAQALDERRAFFRQNTVYPHPNMKQVWFPGVHSDVGGSYPQAESGLANATLRWMLKEAIAAGLQVDPARASDILNVDPFMAKPLPNAMMHNSLTFGWWILEFVNKWTRCCIGSKPGIPNSGFWIWYLRRNLFRRRYLEDGVTIHQSVLDRMALMPSYRPSNLPETYVIEPDSTTQPSYDPAVLNLAIGASTVVGIFSSQKWNNTTVKLQPGEQYHLAATGNWYDATTTTDAAGYSSKHWYSRLFEPLLRDPKSNWFALIGAIGEQNATRFLIGSATSFTVPAGQTGILHCYANDLALFYFNNSGCVQLTITRTA
jgi:uncharacterized protein (DUF2235 family)